MKEDYIKVSLNLPRSVFAKVERMAKIHSLNRTSVIRQAIDLEDLLDSIRKNGGKVYVKEGIRLNPRS